MALRSRHKPPVQTIALNYTMLTMSRYSRGHKRMRQAQLLLGFRHGNAIQTSNSNGSSEGNNTSVHRRQCYVLRHVYMAAKLGLLSRLRC